MPEMTPEAMHSLSSSVRRMRSLLEDDLTRQLDRRFRLAVSVTQAGLREKERIQRQRLEHWMNERARARLGAGTAPNAETLTSVREALVSEMASQALLRLFLLRQLEACGLSRPMVLAGGWSSTGYLEFRSHAPGLTDSQSDSEYEGLDLLLHTLFDELAVDLPGLYEERPLDGCFRLSPATLREVVNVLNAPELETAWEDDTTLGWVYQFWNDPRREAIDERVGPRGKITPQEIASKTQLFTERYMVEWLLQNSVGRIALSMRSARSGEPFEAQTAPSLSMFIPAAGPTAPDGLPATLAELKILDPACGSGHFLAGAFDLLVPLYREEAAALGHDISDQQIAENIIKNNLHGIDIDGRAVQVAAAVLYLKARRLAAGAHQHATDAVVPPMNLVATAIDLDGLPPDDPALTALSAALPGGRENIAKVIAELRHVSVCGSLMRFSPAVEQSNLFEDVNAHITRFIAAHSSDDDLGVRFDGPQLSAGLRLRSLLVEKKYDVVLFNPPYLATSKIDLPPEVLADAFGDSPDLFAAFVERALELTKPTGLIAFVALSNWMFLNTFQKTRERILEGKLLLVADVGKGAFRWASKLIQSAMVIAAPSKQAGGHSLGAQVGSRDAIAANQTDEIAAELRQSSSYKPFDPAAFSCVDQAPLLFWLDADFLRRYSALPKVAEVADCSGGIATTNNERFLRAVWELPVTQARAAASGAAKIGYRPYIKGAEGRGWIEPYRWVIRTARDAIELRELLPNVRPDVPDKLGVAYTTIGHRFGLRLHSVASVRDVSGASVFPRVPAAAGETFPNVNAIVCALNRTPVRELAGALNPTVNFQLGDVRRLPFDPVEDDEQIVAHLRAAFAEEEQASELSLNYRKPGASTWRETQRWAQSAVDRPLGESLPGYQVTADEPSADDSISFGVGVALGRFGADGEGLLEQAPASALPGGILFLGTDGRDSLEHDACSVLREAWERHGTTVGGRADLGTYLRKSFFTEHNRRYEKRPIYLPLSSAKRSYVAFVPIHRWQADTLNVLLADHLMPEKRRVEGELDDVRRARAQSDAKNKAERRFAELQKLSEELGEFIDEVTRVAECGPSPADSKTPSREVDARFVFDLEDGIQINCATLWSLLEPQWKDPKKLWKEIATAKGRKKDYDWAHAAERYFPKRVRAKCATDASLAIAHACFWEFHPAKAFAWELRQEDEFGVLEEPAAESCRSKFREDSPKEAEAIQNDVRLRRNRASSRDDEPLLGTSV